MVIMYCIKQRHTVLNLFVSLCMRSSQYSIIYNTVKEKKASTIPICSVHGEQQWWLSIFSISANTEHQLYSWSKAPTCWVEIILLWGKSSWINFQGLLVKRLHFYILYKVSLYNMAEETLRSNQLELSDAGLFLDIYFPLITI